MSGKPPPIAFRSASSCSSIKFRNEDTVIVAPGAPARVSMAFARIARWPLSLSDDLKPIMLPSPAAAY